LKPFPVATTICCGIVQHKINEKTTMQQQPTKHKNIYKTYKKKKESQGTRTQDQRKQKCQKGTKAEINVAGRQPRTRDHGARTKDQGPVPRTG